MIDLTHINNWMRYSDDEIGIKAAGETQWYPFPYLQSKPHLSWARAATVQTFSLPVTFSMEFEWTGEDDWKEWAGIHVVFLQDNDHNYDFGIRVDGQCVFVQEWNNQYTRLSGYRTHEIKPDGCRHSVDITFDPVNDHKAYWDGRDGTHLFLPQSDNAHHKFPYMMHGRLGLRLDRQDVNIYHPRVLDH